MAALLMMNQMQTTGTFGFCDPPLSSRSSQQIYSAEAEKTMDYIKNNLSHIAKNRNIQERVLELVNAINQAIICRVAPLAMRTQVVQALNTDDNLSTLGFLNELHNKTLQETPNVTAEKKSFLRRFVDYIKAIPKKISTYFLSEAKFAQMVCQVGMGIDYFIYKICNLLTDSYNFKELSLKEQSVKAICLGIAFATDCVFTQCLPGLPSVVGHLVGIVVGLAGPFVIDHLMDLTSWVYKKISEFVRSPRSPAMISNSNRLALDPTVFLGVFPSTTLRD
ncbi:uncharacterized protein RB166_006088 [Leptodactylus fuscus]|uniref:uncharacterized protein LOC142200248 n=1 Tax=Leptodactylus fuscus TaxID=238119 RepID=UPI003F4EE113